MPNKLINRILAVTICLSVLTVSTLRPALLLAANNGIGAKTNNTLHAVTDNDPSSPPPPSPIILQRQIRIQREFQDLIKSTQERDDNNSDCRTARILYKPNNKNNKEFDGFGNEVQFMAKYLQIAVATNRKLVLSRDFTSAYAPLCSSSTDNKNSMLSRSLMSTKKKKKKKNYYSCLWNPVSTCTKEENIGGKLKEDDDDDVGRSMLPKPLGVGIVKSDSTYFNARYYGPRRVVEVDMFAHLNREMLADVIPNYERMFGRFWIRSQVAHYLWANHQTQYLQNALQERLPAGLGLLPPPGDNTNSGSKKRRDRYIAFHIRLTDNVFDFDRDFGRDAVATRKFERFMEIANDIQRKDPGVRHIYVATDNADMAKAMKKRGKGESENHNDEQPRWTFHVQDKVKRGKDDSEFMWFKDDRAKGVGAIAADIETLRQADYLVGSFQSNVFRLAAELNLAYHSDKYEWSSGGAGSNRIYAIDVEWYEDP